VWKGSTLAESASVEGSLLAARVRVGRHARLAPGAVLGEDTSISDHSRTH
jgi:bifunctional N-acetylglucosamine-1-phosphate-uridyltransferase/glucosamine-1-phosphate-acetyltransferase GlmU-like protein